MPTFEPLTDRDAAMLAFEQQWWLHRGAKEQAIRDQFGMSPTAFHQRITWLIDQPAAAIAEPQVVARLRRQRDQGAVRLGTGRRLIA